MRAALLDQSAGRSPSRGQGCHGLSWPGAGPSTGSGRHRPCHCRAGASVSAGWGTCAGWCRCKQKEPIRSRSRCPRSVSTSDGDRRGQMLRRGMQVQHGCGAKRRTSAEEAVRIPTKSAGASERRRLPIPIEAARPSHDKKTPDAEPPGTQASNIGFCRTRGWGAGERPARLDEAQNAPTSSRRAFWQITSK